MDPELEARLRTLYRLEVEHAVTDLQASPIAELTPRPDRSGGFLAAGLVMVAALLVALSLRNGLGTFPGAGTGTTEPMPTLAPGPNQDAIPATIDGQPVLTREAIADAIAMSTDDTPFLIGGWFPAGDDSHGYCMRLAPGPASCTPYLLHLSKGSEETLFVYPSGASADIALHMATQPVVMRVHTHDAGCRNLPNADGCGDTLVLEAIVWLGPRS
jgi:hypothetical protein